MAGTKWQLSAGSQQPINFWSAPKRRQHTHSPILTPKLGSDWIGLGPNEVGAPNRLCLKHRYGVRRRWTGAWPKNPFGNQCGICFVFAVIRSKELIRGDGKRVGMGWRRMGVDGTGGKLEEERPLEQMFDARTSIKLSWRGVTSSHAVSRKLYTGNKNNKINCTENFFKFGFKRMGKISFKSLSL